MEIGSIIMKKKERTWYHAASIGKKIACVKSGGIKMGKWDDMS